MSSMSGAKLLTMDFDEPGKFGSDTDLAAAAAEGDGNARRVLVDRLLDRVGITVRCLAAGDPDADDYVQDVFIEILNSIGRNVLQWMKFVLQGTAHTPDKQLIKYSLFKLAMNVWVALRFR